MKHLSLRWQIALTFSLLAAAALLLLGLYLERVAEGAAVATVEERLLAEARLGAQSLPIPPWQAGPDLQRRADRLDQTLRARVTLLDADGRVLADSREDAARLESHATRPERLQALGQGWGRAVRLSGTEQLINVYVALALPPDNPAPSVLRLSVPLVSVQAALRQLRQIWFFSLVLSVLLIVAFSTWLAGGLARPVQNLVRAARRVERGDLQARAEGHPAGELGELTAVFNSALDRLQGVLSSSQREARHLAAILDQMTDGVIVVDPSGRVELVNPAFERLFGLTLDAARGRALEEVVLNYDLALLLRRSLDRGTAERGEVRLLDPSQARALYGVASPLFSDTADPMGAVGLVRDVTEITRLDQVRRDFVANASHELRTPAAGLRALAEVLQSGALRDPDKAAEFVARIVAEADRLTSILDDMLTLTQVERGPELLHPRLLPARPALEEASLRVGPAALAHRISLHLDAADADELYADPSALQTALVNLLENAIKYSPEGAEVRLSGRAVAGGYEIAVADHGIGIPEEHLSRIFERFYRVDKARSRATGGTGLGLSIVKHIVEAHRGRVTVQSAPGQGSTFTLFFPSP